MLILAGPRLVSVQDPFGREFLYNNASFSHTYLAREQSVLWPIRETKKEMWRLAPGERKGENALDRRANPDLGKPGAGREEEGLVGATMRPLPPAAVAIEIVSPSLLARLLGGWPGNAENSSGCSKTRSSESVVSEQCFPGRSNCWLPLPKKTQPVNLAPPSSSSPGELLEVGGEIRKALSEIENTAWLASPPPQGTSL